jgi:YVTN family beta-propeller protein
MLSAAVGNPHPQTGAVVITVDGVDRDADPLTYTTTIPAKGAVDGDPLKVGTMPQMLAVTPDTRRVYVPNQQDDTVSVIDTDPASANYNHVIAVIPVGAGPYSAAVSPDGTRVYVANAVSDTVSVICVVPG